MIQLQINTPAPEFTVQSTQGEIKLADFRGHPVILYFYPKDSTPGCTIESCGFRDQYKHFQELGAVILGISRDSLKSHEKFKTKHDLPFTLLSDTDETVCNLYGVIHSKNMFGLKVRGIQRSTFLIDKQGHLQREWRKVKIAGHVSEVLQAVKELG